MKNFDWVAPTSLDQVLQSLPRARGSEGTVRMIAGGQDLLTEMKEHIAEPERLVSLKKVPELQGFEVAADGSVRIGALTRLSELENSAELKAAHPAVAEAAASVASAQIRSQATLGGNLCQKPRCWYYRNEHAVCIKKGGAECFSFAGLNKYNAILGGGPSYIVHPSDVATALVASDAEVTLRGPGGERTVSMDRFFTLPGEGSILRENVLGTDEVLTEIRLPSPAGRRSVYLKFKERSSYDFAVGAVGLAVKESGGVVTEARLVMGAVAPIPWRSPEGEAALIGKALSDETAIAAGKAALAKAEALEHNGYKVPLVQGLIRKAVASLRSV